jgi:hypothetical protein
LPADERQEIEQSFRMRQRLGRRWIGVQFRACFAKLEHIVDALVTVILPQTSMWLTSFACHELAAKPHHLLQRINRAGALDG